MSDGSRGGRGVRSGRCGSHGGTHLPAPALIPSTPASNFANDPNCHHAAAVFVHALLSESTHTHCLSRNQANMRASFQSGPCAFFVVLCCCCRAEGGVGARVSHWMLQAQRCIVALCWRSWYEAGVEPRRHSASWNGWKKKYLFIFQKSALIHPTYLKAIFQTFYVALAPLGCVPVASALHNWSKWSCLNGTYM